MIFNRSSPSLRQLNRTFIGSVLFIDIVGYSRRTVPDQLAMKEVFNRLLTDAVQTVAPAERIMVDTGDGAGVAFLGDPEDALFTALSLRDAIVAGKADLGEPGFVRMGINLGPLKMVRDINGHTNMIGDGVNDAQRVMSFAEPGQVMVSHAYLDIISRFSRDYTKLFVYEGTRHDKHVREHEVYRFGPTEGAEQLTEQLNEKMRDRGRTGLPEDAGGQERNWDVERQPAAGHAVSAVREDGAASLAASARRKSKAAGTLAVVSLGALLVAGALWSWISSQKDRPITALAAVSEQEATKEATPASTSAIKNDDKTDQIARNSADKPAVAVSQKEDNNQAERKEEPALKPGTIKLSVQPWGEIYVDGSRRGVSPPLKSLSLAPGKHRIEIRNSQFAPYKQTVEVKSNAVITVHYVF